VFLRAAGQFGEVQARQSEASVRDRRGSQRPGYS